MYGYKRLFKTIYKILLCLVLTSSLKAQDFEKHSQIGFNLSPLISQFIPFSNASNQKGPYTVLFRRYNQKKENKTTGFEFGIGMDIAFNNEISFLNMRFGYISKRNITEKWTTVGSFDFALFAGGFNLPGDTTEDEAGIGFNVGRSIEYEIFPNATLGTEIIAFFGASLSDEGPVLKVIPPIAIYFNFRL
jgi:hypothetical protein